MRQRPVIIVKSAHDPARGGKCGSDAGADALHGYDGTGLSVYTRASANGGDRNVSLPSRPMKIKGGDDSHLAAVLVSQIASLNIDRDLEGNVVRREKIERSLGIKQRMLARVQERL